MTREEAIMVLKNEQPHCGKKALFPEEKKYEAYNVAIKALEQEPCDDAISRQAVEEAIYDYSRSCDVNYAQIMEYIDKLPSVNPQPKTGHWEWLTEDKYRCSNCNHETRVDECMNKPMYDFCPFCGVKMVESEGVE